MHGYNADNSPSDHLIRATFITKKSQDAAEWLKVEWFLTRDDYKKLNEYVELSAEKSN